MPLYKVYKLMLTSEVFQLFGLHCLSTWCFTVCKSRNMLSTECKTSRPYKSSLKLLFLQTDTGKHFVSQWNVSTSWLWLYFEFLVLKNWNMTLTGKSPSFSNAIFRGSLVAFWHDVFESKLPQIVFLCLNVKQLLILTVRITIPCPEY